MIKRGISRLLTLAALLTVLIPWVSASELAVERQVFSFLTEELGLNTAAACGVLANIEAESGFRLTNMGDSGSSFGLCQWHNSRFHKLRAFCTSRGLDYTTVEGQMQYLTYELKTSYQSTYAILRNVPNTVDGAYTAAYAWCIYYERPAGMEQSGARRGLNAQMKYWVRYGGTASDGTELSGNSYSGSLFGQQEQTFYWEKDDSSGVIPGTTIQRPGTVPSQTEPAGAARPDGTDQPAEKPAEQVSPSYSIQYVPHHLPAEKPLGGGAWSCLFLTAAPVKKKNDPLSPCWTELPDQKPEDVPETLPWELGEEENAYAL